MFVRGRIDRVDLGERGETVVYDYKGRAAPPAARWLQDSTWQVALYMRVVQQALGKQAVGGFYQPLAGKELAARGAFDCEAGGARLRSSDSLGHEEFERLIEDVCWRHGRPPCRRVRGLEPRPDSCAYNGGCSYPTICRCER